MDFRQYLILDEVAAVLRETEVLFLEMDPVQPTRDRLKYIDPLTRKNWRLTDKWRQLAAIVNHESRKAKDPTPPDRIWITFSDVPRLGMPQHIRSGKTTPYGVFAYPAPYVLKQASKSGGVPYAGDRAYMIVFKVKEAMAEVGHKGSETSDRYTSGELKGDLKKSLDRSLPQELENKRAKLVAWLQTWLYDNKKGKKQPKSELHEIARSMLDRVFRQISQESRNYPNGVEAAQALQQQNIEGMFDPTEQRKEKADTAKEQLKSYIEGLYMGYDYRPKYINIGDDLSAEISGDFKKYIQESTDSQYYYPGWKELDLEGRKPLEWIVQNDKKAFSGGSYGYGNQYLKNYRSTHPQEGQTSAYDSPYLKKMFAFLAKQLKKALASYKEIPFDQVNYPMKPELNMVASKFGADLKGAVQQAMGNAENGKQFIYRATEAMAKEIAGARPWQAIWNKMLRLIGWDHIVDTHHSGHVHSSEPTQGAFMDTSKIEQIALIVNKAFVNQDDQSQRPNLSPKDISKGGWTPYDDSESAEFNLRRGMHSRTQGPVLNRKGPTAGGQGNPTKGTSVSYGFSGRMGDVTGKSALQRTLMNLNYRLEQFAYALPSLGKRKPDQLAPWLAMLIKILKTTRSLKDSVSQMPKPEPGQLFSDKDAVADRATIKPHIGKMEALLRKINSETTAMKSTLPPSTAVLGQMIDSVIKLSSPTPEDTETPRFERPFWKTPGFKKQFAAKPGGVSGQSLAVLQSGTKSGYYVQESEVSDGGSDTTYFGPFNTQVGAITACVLCGDKDWKHYWSNVVYWGGYDVSDAVQNGSTLKPPASMALKMSASEEEVKAMEQQIEGEAQSEGYI